MSTLQFHNRSQTATLSILVIEKYQNYLFFCESGAPHWEQLNAVLKPAFVEGVTLVEVVLSNFSGGVSRWDYMGSGEFRLWPNLSCPARFTQIVHSAFTEL